MVNIKWVRIYKELSSVSVTLMQMDTQFLLQSEDYRKAMERNVSIKWGLKGKCVVGGIAPQRFLCLNPQNL